MIRKTAGRRPGVPRTQGAIAMRRVLSCCLGLVLLAAPARAGEPQGKLVHEHWDAAYLQGGKSGHVRTTVRETERGGQKFYLTTVELHLTIKRFKDTVQLRMDTGAAETADGKVVSVFMRQYLGKGKTLTVRGVVKGKQLHLTEDDTKPLPPNPWNDQVVGPYRQQRLFAERRVKPGDEFSYDSYEPTVSMVVTNRVKVKDYEEVAVNGGAARRRLLRVET